MKNNKIGVMFLVSVLALAGIGISYAGWTDAITVGGTVETGDVDINLVGWYSGTWVYKDVPNHDVFNNHEFTIGNFNTDPDPPVDPADPDRYELVASAWAEPGEGNDEVDITFDNLFPCQDFVVDFILHYEGSIPARINGPILIATHDADNPQVPLPKGFKDSEMDWLEYLWYNNGITVEACRCEPIGADPITGWTLLPDQPVDVGYQLHNCYYVYVKITIHIPQDDAYQNLSGGFSTALEVIQWDEYDTE